MQRCNAVAARRRRRRQPPAAASAQPRAATPAPTRWRRLDVAPFLVLYAVWAVWVLETLVRAGGEATTLIQLVTSLLLAVHVSALACFVSLAPAPGGSLAWVHAILSAPGQRI